MKNEALIFSGRTYISSKRASRLTGYTTDYIGQLARARRLDARLVGRSWYVEEGSICGHRREKATTYDSAHSVYTPVKRKGEYTARQRALVNELTSRTHPLHEQDASKIYFEYEIEPLLPPLKKAEEAHREAVVEDVSAAADRALEKASAVHRSADLQRSREYSHRAPTTYWGAVRIAFSTTVLAAVVLALLLGVEVTYTYTSDGGLSAAVGLVQHSL